MNMVNWHVGCSGFHYKHWKEVFYPKGVPQRLWFEYYCKHFNTLELNVTFYRFPALSVFKGWYERSTPDFSFSVKAPRLITHYKKLNDCETLIDNFYQTVKEGLKEKAGCFLFQFAPSFSFTKERLDKIINNLNPKFPNVVELRHSSWWNTEVYKEFGKNNISFSGMSHPLLPDTIIENTSLLYYRMHGVPRLYESPYSLEYLKDFAMQVASFQKTKNAFIYFNNDIGCNAIKNAVELKEITKEGLV
jgi:uncharacterized protein YecE (DUF72 family)